MIRNHFKKPLNLYKLKIFLWILRQRNLIIYFIFNYLAGSLNLFKIIHKNLGYGGKF